MIATTGTGLQVHFDSLTWVDSAHYNSSARESANGCLDGTCADVLDRIHAWIASNDGRVLFWLTGVAGTGKSSIAHTIAEFYGHKKTLGGSFFFSRDQQARRETKYLFQTIAFQMGNAHPLLKTEIAGALKNQMLLKSNLRTQLRELILNPIANLSHQFPSPIVVIFDALDDRDAVVDIVQSLVKESLLVSRVRPLPLRFLLTSRPEWHLQYVFQDPVVEEHRGEQRLSEVRRNLGILPVNDGSHTGPGFSSDPNVGFAEVRVP